MNYRHAFHAGNAADVMKHALLARILVHLMAKDTPFRVIDTHAGAGLYDLRSEEAMRTGEAERGIRLLGRAALATAAVRLLEPYLGAVRNVGGADVARYPGSPMIAAHLLRPGDRMTFVEKHDEDHAVLARRFIKDRRVTIRHGDGWLALKALLPPPERRGLVLIDPPYEAADEFRRLIEGLHEGHRRFAHGVFAIWYPVKHARAVQGFIEALVAAAIPKTLRLELVTDPRATGERLGGSGLIVINPPWALKDEADILLPALAAALASGSRAGYRVEWLVGEG
jgi:23S rRNA (adenine2030-N6)-methyltransferase